LPIPAQDAHPPFRGGRFFLACDTEADGLRYTPAARYARTLALKAYAIGSATAEWMPSGTQLLYGVLGSRPNTSQDVRLMRDDLHMARVNASTNATEVVDNQAARNWAD
jgi:hypothetical protein